MADTVKNGWVARVLGVTLPEDGAAGGGGVDLTQAAQAWRAASETVDGQIAALQAALLQDGDGELAEIAEFGLNAITGGYKVRFMAALMEAEGGSSKARATLAQIIPDFRQHLDSDERVEACDENPFGVAMSVRATLIPALDQLARVVAGER